VVDLKKNNEVLEEFVSMSFPEIMDAEQEDRLFTVLRRLSIEKMEIPNHIQNEIMKTAENKELNEYYRKEAFRFLKFVNDEDLRNKIAFDGLEDEVYGIRKRSAELLGLKAVLKLESHLQSENQKFRLSAVSSFGYILNSLYDEIAVDYLESALGDPSFTIWHSALKDLAKMLRWSGDEIDFGDRILSILLDHENATRNEIIPQEESFPNKNDTTFADTYYFQLCELELDDMALLNHQSLVDFMINRGLNSPSGSVRRFSWFFLTNNRIDTVPDNNVLLGLNDDDSNVRRNTIQYIGVVPSSNLVPYIVENLSNEENLMVGTGLDKTETTLRATAFIALAQIADVDHFHKLIETYNKMLDFEKFQVIPILTKANWPDIAKEELRELLTMEVERDRSDNLVGGISNMIFGIKESLHERASKALLELQNK
jgi:HEAT repeat protein